GRDRRRHPERVRRRPRARLPRRGRLEGNERRERRGERAGRRPVVPHARLRRLRPQGDHHARGRRGPTVSLQGRLMPRRVSEEAPPMSTINPTKTRRGIGRRKLVAALGALLLLAGIVAVNAVPHEHSASALPPVPPTNPSTIATIPPTTGTAP